MFKRRESGLLSEKKAWADYTKLVNSLEEEFLAMIGHETETEDQRNANANGVAALSERFLNHPVAETSLDRINYHIMFALAQNSPESSSECCYPDERIIAFGGLEVKHVLATQSDDGMPLAVKILRLGSNENIKKVFKNEQVVLAKLWFFYKNRYPKNIIKLHAIGDEVTATERIAGGRNLREAMKQGSSLEGVIGWIKDIVDGLEDLYKAGFESNGDLAPANCILGEDGVVYICDLSMVEDKSYSLPDGQYRFPGREMYVPPEKCVHYSISSNNEKPVIDKRSDVYILGIMIYQFLTQGKDPFKRHAFTDEEKEDKDGMILGALAKKIKDFGLNIHTSKGVIISKEKIDRYAEKYRHRTLSPHAHSYIKDDEVLGQIDVLLGKCFAFDLKIRPQSPRALLQELMSILEPIMPKT